MQLLASIIKWLIYVTSILVILLSVSVFTLDVTTCACNQQSDLTITATMGQIILAFLMALSSTPALYHYWSPRLIYILMMVALSILLLVTRQFAAADYRFPLVSPVMVNALLGILFCYLMYERTGGGQDFCISLVQENFYESPPAATSAAASEDAARRNSSKESKTSDQLSASNETRVTIFSSTDNSTGNSGGVGNNNTNGIVSLEQSQNMKNNMHNKKGDDFSAKNNSTQQQQQQQQVSPMQMRASPIRRVTSTVKRKNVPFATAKNKDKINNNKNKYIDNNNNNKDKDNINNRKANTTGAETPGTISSTDENGDLREKLANKAMPIDSLQI